MFGEEFRTNVCIGFTWERRYRSNMSESPTVDEFIRHMQAELDACDDIVDKNERQKRQWQIESSLLLAIEFSTRFKELSKLGQNPLKIVQALSTLMLIMQKLQSKSLLLQVECARTAALVLTQI